MTAWGEPLAGVSVSASGSGPFTFKIQEVPSYNAFTLRATFTGTTSPANVNLKGTSATFNVQANKANPVSLPLTK